MLLHVLSRPPEPTDPSNDPSPPIRCVVWPPPCHCGAAPQRILRSSQVTPELQRRLLVHRLPPTTTSAMIVDLFKIAAGPVRARRRHRPSGVTLFNSIALIHPARVALACFRSAASPGDHGLQLHTLAAAYSCGLQLHTRIGTLCHWPTAAGSCNRLSLQPPLVPQCNWLAPPHPLRLRPLECLCCHHCRCVCVFECRRGRLASDQISLVVPFFATPLESLLPQRQLSTTASDDRRRRLTRLHPSLVCIRIRSQTARWPRGGFGCGPSPAV